MHESPLRDNSEQSPIPQHFNPQRVEDDGDNTVYSSKSMDTPKSVKVPLKDEASESSFGFARLPARQPFTKKSMGRASRASSRERSWLDIKPSSVDTSHDNITQDGTTAVNSNRTSISSLDSWRKSLAKLMKPVDSMDAATSELAVHSNSHAEEISHVAKLDEPLSSSNETDISAKIHEESSASPSRMTSKVESNASPSGLKRSKLRDFSKARNLLSELNEKKAKALDSTSPIRPKISPQFSSPQKPKSPSQSGVRSPNQVLLKKTAGPESPENEAISRLLAPTFSSALRSNSPRLGHYPEGKSSTVSHQKNNLDLRSNASSRLGNYDRPNSPTRVKSPSRLGQYPNNRLSPSRPVSPSRPLSPTRQNASPSRMGQRELGPRDSPSRLGNRQDQSKQLYPKVPKLLHGNSDLKQDASPQRSLYSNPAAGKLPTFPSRMENQSSIKPTFPRLTSQADYSGSTTSTSSFAKVPLAKFNPATEPAALSKKTVDPKAASTLPLKMPKLKAIAPENETSAESFSQKFKAAVGDAKPAGPALLKRNPVLEESAKIKSSAPAPLAKTAQKRSSELAFDSPDQSLSNRPVTTAQLGPPSKKASFGLSMNLMRSAVVKNASYLPQVDGVKISNDKLRFASISSSSSTSSTSSMLSMGPTNYQQLQSLKLSTASSETASYASANSSAANSSYGGSNPHSFYTHPNSQITPSTTKTYAAHTPAQSKTDLPDIFSESEDDGDGSVLLDWANSPELRSMLIQQQQVDPDSVFGPVAPLHMEEVFKSARLSKFRARSSSANWHGQDKLTQQEVESYAKEMGYK